MAVDIAEIYNPPRVTAEAVKYHLEAGEAIDLILNGTLTRRTTDAEPRSVLLMISFRLLAASTTTFATPAYFPSALNFRAWACVFEHMFTFTQSQFV